MKVRRLKFESKEKNDLNLRNGAILIEYGTIPGFFYLENSRELTGVGFCENFLKRREIWNCFTELEPIDFKKTAWYKIAKEDLESEISNMELGYEVVGQKLKELKELYQKII